MSPTSLSAASSLTLSTVSTTTKLSNSSPVLPHAPRTPLLARMTSHPTLDPQTAFQDTLERLEKEKHAEIEKATTAYRESIAQCQADISHIQDAIDALQAEKQSIEARIEPIRGPMPYALMAPRNALNSDILRNIEKITHCYTQITNCNHEIEAITLDICEKHNPKIDRIKEQLKLFDKDT